jgi:hypothetical protein
MNEVFERIQIMQVFALFSDVLAFFALLAPAP